MDDKAVLATLETEELRRRLGEILLASGAIDEATLARALAEQHKAPFVDPLEHRVLRDRLVDVPPSELEGLGFVPLQAEGSDGTLVAVGDPTDRDLVERIQELLGESFKLAVATPTAILRALLGEGREQVSASFWQAGQAEVVPDGASPVAARAPLRLEGLDALAPLVQARAAREGQEDLKQLLLTLLSCALGWGSTGLRLRPTDQDVDVSYRLDNQWQPVLRLPAWTWPGLLSETASELGLASLAEPNALHGLNLDALGPGGEPVQFRLHAPAERSGELTLLLRDARSQHSLRQLGLDGRLMKRLRRWTAARQGLVLVTGRPSSGRTALLWALATELAPKRPTRALLHSPVVPTPGESLIERGQDALAARSALEDAALAKPEVFVVDDCDDVFLAEDAFSMGLREKLVIASVRGRDAADAMQRLRDSGLPDRLLGEQLLGIVETRLLRALCKGCSLQAPLDVELAIRLGLVVDSMPTQLPAAGQGCGLCHGTGYGGLIALASAVDLAGGVRRDCTAQELRAAVESARLFALSERGLGIVSQGATSLQELARVLAPQPPPGADGGPLVTVHSPMWNPETAEETVADDASPTQSMEVLTLDIDDPDESDRHVILLIGTEHKQLLRETLPPTEFAVFAVEGIAEALAAVRRDLPTALVLSRGASSEPCEALRTLRDDLATAFLPLVVLSPDSSGSLDLFRAGADEVLPSSTPPEELELRLRAVIRRVT